jgi:hypothetical protein
MFQIELVKQDPETSAVDFRKMLAENVAAEMPEKCSLPLENWPVSRGGR